MDLLAELRAAYRATIPERVEELARFLASARRAEAIAVAHRLRGTAGTYGFLDVGDAAGRIEDALLAGAPMDALTDALAALRDSVDR